MEKDPQYEKLHRKYETALKTELKNRFDRYALLATWDYQTPKNCTFHEEQHGAAGAEIPAAVEKHVTQNYFAPEDFEAFIVQAARRNETMRQILALLREPPLPGQIAIPYLGDVNTYEQVLRIVAKDKVALNVGGSWFRKEPGESLDEALRRLHQRAWCTGQAMFLAQLGEISQVGSAGIAVAPPVSTATPPSPQEPGPQPNQVTGGDVLTPPACPQPVQSGAEPNPPAQNVIRRTLGAKTGVNLLGDLEKWALPDAQKVTQASLTFSGVTVKELRDLCVKLPPKLQAELQLTIPPEGGPTK
jgi:hypothetical protein